MPPPASGDEDVDALFHTMETTAPHASVEELVQRAGADPRVRLAVHRQIEHILQDPPPPAPPRLDDPELRAALARRLHDASVAWFLRNELLGALFGLLATTPDDETTARLVEWTQLVVGAWRRRAARAIFSMPEGRSRREALSGVARHFVAGDPLAPLGAVALVLRDGDDALGRVRSTLAEMDAISREDCAIHLSREEARLDLDRCPDWVDVLYSNAAAAIDGSYALRAARTSEPLLRALAHAHADVAWSDILLWLQAVGEPRAALRLATLAKTLPRRSRSRPRTVGSLAKLLRRRQNATWFEIDRGPSSREERR